MALSLCRCLILAALLSPLTAQADDWETTDSVMLGSAIVVMAVDWGQTRNLARSGGKYFEKNPLLGDQPDIGTVDKYFAAAMLGTIGLSYALPQYYRRYFLGGVIFVEVLVVGRNHQLGLRAEF